MINLETLNNEEWLCSNGIEVPIETNQKDIEDEEILVVLRTDMVHLPAKVMFSEKEREHLLSGDTSSFRLFSVNKEDVRKVSIGWEMVLNDEEFRKTRDNFYI